MRPGADRTLSAVQVPPNCDLTLGLVCLDKSEPDRTVWQMAADERFANPTGVVQGGILGAFADSAMAATAIRWANSRRAPAKMLTANVEMKVSFLAPARTGSVLTCSAQVISGGSRAVFVEAEVRDISGALVAKASSTYLLTEHDR